MQLQTRRRHVAAALLAFALVLYQPVGSADELEEPPALSAYQLSTVTKLDPRDRTRANGWRLAKMGIGENSKPLRRTRCTEDGCPQGVSLRKDGTNGRPTADHAAILQTAENKRVELEGIWRREVRLREALRILAPHIVGDRELSPGPQGKRQGRLRKLPPVGRKMPAGYPDPAMWREQHGANWQRFLAWATQAVTVGFFPVCPGKPIAYGGNIDNPIAVARGLCVLECGDLDTFWAHPGFGCELTDPRTVAAYKAVEVMKRRRARYLARRRAAADTEP